MTCFASRDSCDPNTYSGLGKKGHRGITCWKALPFFGSLIHNSAVFPSKDHGHVCSAMPKCALIRVPRLTSPTLALPT